MNKYYIADHVIRLTRWRSRENDVCTIIELCYRRFFTIVVYLNLFWILFGFCLWITGTRLRYVYDLFKGHTFYMQKVFNEAFALTGKGGTCRLDTIMEAIDRVLSDKETTYMEILSALSEKQKPLLYAIAAEGLASRVTSLAFTKKHNLESASAIQSAIRQLLNQNLITEIHREYSVIDKFFALWINRIYNEKVLTIN